MIARPLLLVIICIGFFILLQTLVPEVMALKGSSKVNELLLENQRTRKRNNYLIRMDRNNKILRSTESMGYSYDNIPIQSEINIEEQPPYIVDYANMMRDDVILLDNSVETRTRKRGNIRLKKTDQALRVPTCNCESTRNTADFGANSFPRYVETWNCSVIQEACQPPYICQENIYNVIIIRRRDPESHHSLEYPYNLPNELKHKWIAEKRPISVGCTCTRDYIIED